jgi:transketolase
MIIERSFASGVGHIASALSIIDMLAVLWGAVRRKDDRFILCKGHAALALYAVLRWKDEITPAQFDSFCADGSAFGQHPEPGIPTVDFATGSLGQGLSVGCGLALGMRARGEAGRVFCLLSDGECDEGQVWEAAAFAGHHRLDRLTALVDANGLQALGRTRDVLDLSPLRDKFGAFRWDATEVDGHDHAALEKALTRPGTDGRPRMVVCRTVQGKGVSFMEDALEWHYRNLSPELKDRALAELAP